MNPAITNSHRPMTDEVVDIWEAFDCFPPMPHRHRVGPTVRPASDQHGRPATVVMRDYDGLDPDTGVHHMSITMPDGVRVALHGDDVNGCFIKVYGLSEQAVRDRLDRVMAAMPAFLREVWR